MSQETGQCSIVLHNSSFRGGYICLAQWMMAGLVGDWRGAPLELSKNGDSLHELYDFKESALTDALKADDYFDEDYVYDPVTYDNMRDWYSNTRAISPVPGSVNYFTQQ